MSDILKVTTPTVGYENTGRPSAVSQNDTLIQNIADPTRVTRPDGKNVNSENDNNRFSLEHKSNFDKFVQIIKNTPSLAQLLSEMMILKSDSIVSSGMEETIAKQISEFMELMKMSETEVFDFLKQQSDSSLKFKGPFFDMLRQAISDDGSLKLKTDILEFLKVYNDTTSNEHVLKNITTNLKNLEVYLPKSFSEKFSILVNRIITDAKGVDSAGINASNSALLKNEIIPFLSAYVGRTHDMGIVRDFITMLTLNIARYENGNKDNYEIALKSILGYNVIKEKLYSMDPDQLRTILSPEEYKNENSNLMDKLLDIIERGVKGDAGYEHKAAFNNILSSFLMNESVYMPLIHMMLPLNINGNLFFSELWIDPDNKNSQSNTEDEKAVKVLIKFDIDQVGYFEVILLSRNNKVDLHLYYPEKLAILENEIKKGISAIMDKNNISFNSLYIDKCVKPKLISEVFPQIYERKDSVNVKV